MLICFICKGHHTSSALLCQHLKFHHGLYPGKWTHCILMNTIVHTVLRRRLIHFLLFLLMIYVIIDPMTNSFLMRWMEKHT